MTREAKIRRVHNGFVLELPWPYGGTSFGNGEVIATTLDEAVQLLTRVFDDDMPVGGTVVLRRSWKPTLDDIV